MRRAIEWQEVRRQLQATEDSLRKSLSDSPERIKAVFRERAISLAHEKEPRPASEGIPVLIFRLARERYAIELKELAEVAPFRSCARVPGTSPQLLGVINLRGELRPVIDLALVLSGSPSFGPGVALMLRRQAALRVDEVEDLRDIPPDELTQCVQGQHLRARASGALALLDVEAVLSTVFRPKEPRLV